MSDSVDLGKACDCTGLRIHQCIKNHLDCLLVCRHCSFCNLFVQSGLLVYQSSVDSDSLTETFCHYRFALRIDELIF